MLHSSWKLLAAGVLTTSLAAVGVVAQDSPRTNERQNERNTNDQLDRRAVELGTTALNRVRNANTLRAEIRQTFTMRSPMGRQEMDSTFDFAMQRPNKFAMELKSGMMGETVVSDGEKLYTLFPSLNSYIEKDAPDAMNDLLVKIVSSGGGMGGPMSFLGPLLTMGDPNATEGVRTKIKRAEYKGEEEVDGRQVHHVSYTIVPALPEELANEMREEMGEDFQMTYVFDAWIDAERHTVRKMDFNLAEMMKDMMENMPEEMRDIQYEMVMTFSNWQVNEEIPADRFAFSPPEGAQKFDSLMDAFGAAGGRESGPSPDALLGSRAPDFELQLLEGSQVNLSQHRDRDIVILDFWATWCGPCIRALPGLMEIAEEYRDRNVVLYAVNQREDAETIRTFLERREWELKVPLDRDGSVGRKYNVGGIPQTVIIHKDGTVQAVHVGYMPGLKDQLRSELNALLEGRRLAQAPSERESEDENDNGGN